MALAGVDTAALDSFSDATASNTQMAALREKLDIEFVSGWSSAVTEVEIVLKDGRHVAGCHNAGCPAPDLAGQGRRLEMKFDAVASRVVGPGRAAEIIGLIGRLETLDDIAELAQAYR